jgi:hypothetical protein
MAADSTDFSARRTDGWDSNPRYAINVHTLSRSEGKSRSQRSRAISGRFMISRLRYPRTSWEQIENRLLEHLDIAFEAEEDL